MNEPLTVAVLLDRLRTERVAWEAALEAVGYQRMTEPGAFGSWSAKDLIAHVTWYEAETVALFATRALPDSALWHMPAAERNAVIQAATADLPLRVVKAEAQQVFQQLLDAVRALTDQELNDPQCFADMPADWLPWQVIVGNTYEHYAQHLAELRAWRDG